MNLSDTEIPSPRIAYLLDPIRVQEYARGTGWKLEDRLGQDRMAVYERPESRLNQLSVPLNRDVADFADIMATAVFAIARFEKRPSSEVLTELLFPPSDVLRFAETSPAAASGDVPFDHGIKLLAGARKVILSAVCSVSKPEQFHKRMNLPDAKAFMEKCRLGQTERGSFVLTVACPLNIVPTGVTLFPGHFTRQVTGLLMRSLYHLAHHLERGDVDGIIQNSVPGAAISGNLCDGLLEMEPADAGSHLNIVANYSRTFNEQNTEAPPSIVRLRREIFPYIEKVADRLRPAKAAITGPLLGYVETLDGRPNDENRVEGKVVLRLITPDDTIHARAELNADDYAVADKAHMGNLSISIDGDLQGSTRSYRIENISSFKLTQP